MRAAAILALATIIIFSTSPGLRAEDVLFFGNSFTSVNNVPQLVQDIAVGKGRPIVAVRVTKGGQGFGYHLSMPATDDALKSKPWAWVVLQDQSLGPTTAARKTGIFMDEGTAFYNRIVEEAPTAGIVLYETWAYSPRHTIFKNSSKVVATGTGGQKLSPNEDLGEAEATGKGSALAGKFADPNEMYGQLHDQYGKLQLALAAKDPKRRVVLAPVGTAFARCIREHPEIDLYAADLKHPSREGSYLAALVIYATFSGDSPLGAPVPKKVDAEKAKILQQVAASMFEKKA